jgi:hypothetical protein
VDRDNPQVEIIHRGKYKSLTQPQRRWLKRRQAVEPAIGHLKSDHRMDRCWLQGKLGDALHAALCATGYNLRWLLRAMRRLGLKAAFLRPLYGHSSRSSQLVTQDSTRPIRISGGPSAQGNFAGPTIQSGEPCMGRYKHIDTSLRFLAVDLQRHLRACPERPDRSHARSHRFRQPLQERSHRCHGLPVGDAAQDRALRLLPRHRQQPGHSARLPRTRHFYWRPARA